MNAALGSIRNVFSNYNRELLQILHNWMVMYIKKDFEIVKGKKKIIEKRKKERNEIVQNITYILQKHTEN